MIPPPARPALGSRVWFGPLLIVLLVAPATPALAEVDPGAAARRTDAPSRPPSRAAGAGSRLKEAQFRRRGELYVARTEMGDDAELTLDPRLQETAEDIFTTFEVPFAAAAVLSVPDGRVLALSGRSNENPELGPGELALTAWAPAASVFKVVSAAALVSAAGLSAESRTCYHGGVSSVVADNLVDLPRIDRTCATLAYGIGKSQNAIIAKLAVRHLAPADLERVGRAFAFGAAIPFELPVEPSSFDIPANDALEFARSAAGFFHSTLSPLHGALLAAAIANGGVMPAPTLLARDAAAGDRRSAGRRVLSQAAAKEVGGMMELTTTIGTARTAFQDRRGRPLLPVSVAGKTGTLSADTDHGRLAYSWFVGYAPADDPRIAFAIALGNREKWRIKAAHVARQLVARYLEGTKSRAGAADELVASARRARPAPPM